MRIISILFILMYSWQLSGQDILDGNYESEILRISSIISSDEIIDSLAEKVYRNSGLLAAFDEEMGMYREEELQKSRNWWSSLRLGVSIFSANTYYSGEETSVTSVGVLPNIGLNLSIDPEKLVNRKSYMRQANHKMMRSSNLQKDHMQRLKIEILNHYFQYLSMLETLTLKEHTLNTRQQRLQVLEVNFKNGITTYDEVLIAQNQYDLWNEEFMKSRIEAIRKRKEIDILIGTK